MTEDLPVKHKKAILCAGAGAAALAISAGFCKPVRWMLNPMPRVNGTVHISIDGQPCCEFTAKDCKIRRSEITGSHHQFARDITYTMDDSTLPQIEIVVAGPKWWSAARYDLTYDFDSHGWNADADGTAEIVNERGEWQTVPVDNLRILSSGETANIPEYTNLLHPELTLQNSLGIWG